MPPSKPKPRIGIVDDEISARSRLGAALRGDFEILEGSSYDDAFKLLQDSELDVLLLDINMPPSGLKECLDLLKQLEESDIDTLVMVLSDDNRKTILLKVMDAGAYDCFLKPVDTDVLRPLLERSVEKLFIQRENRILREEIHRKNALGDLIGSTEAMQHLFDSIRRVARSATTVIIRGESGTGKELVARAIHEQSPRRNRSFISVNCAALPESLMEAELFGYEKGAFTGAVEAKEGRIELAHRGTLFLDEIGTLPPALQSKLLRVLEEHELVRLGGKKPIHVDFRLLTATNEDLEDLVRTRAFREDLYYRIHVVPIFLPPLRERSEDIPLLVDYFLRVYCAANQFPLKRISDEALTVLKRFPWPGNVRELENAIQRVVLMAEGDEIALRDLPADIAQTAARDGRGRYRIPASGFKLDEELASTERRWLETALVQAKQDKNEAARLLGVNVNRLYYLCRKYDLGHV